jgi:lipoyl(octanoyl) transferase
MLQMNAGEQMRAREELWVCELGLVPYRDALALQERVAEQVRSERLPDTLLLLEHPPVYTRGRRSAQAELLHGERFYRARGIEVLDSDRGGRITYHGPGQLVGYPIMRVGDVGAYLRAMEAAIIAALAQEGVHARSRCAEGPDYTGVWVAERKIASIGVHVSRGVTTHGFAINVHNQLEPFSFIVACGLSGVAMTSLERQLPPGRRLDPARFRTRVADRFSAVHGRRARAVGASALRSARGPRLPPAPTRGRTPRASRPGALTARADATLKPAIGAPEVPVTSAGART